MLFLWLKVLHIVADISWMGGLLYLPRLMVYHCGSVVGSDSDLMLQVMERRLLRAIMNPAALVAIISGAGLLWLGEFNIIEVWVFAKLMAVVGLVFVHMRLARHVREFGLGARNQGAAYFRVLNEVPTVLMVVIVVAVIVKPYL